MSALLTLVLLASPTTSVDRFIHRLSGAPVGEIELQLTGLHYVYLSRHYFRGGKTSEEKFEPEPLTESNSPEWASLSLLVAHPVGCWPVIAEVTRERGQACVTQAGAKVTGTLLNKPFTARYQHGQLQVLKVGDSEFVRSDQAVQFKDPFRDGFEIGSLGTRLALSPAMQGTSTGSVAGAGDADDSTHESGERSLAECLAAAKDWVATRGAKWELVLGVIEDEGRGWPHAWVRDRSTGQELDPSRPPNAVTRPRYLALPADRAAEVYLELLGKRRALIRVGSE